MSDEREPIELGSDEELALRGLWLSRRMFGWMVGGPFVEERGYEDFLAAAPPVRAEHEQAGT